MHTCILLFTWLKTYKYKQKQINAQATSKQIWHATPFKPTNANVNTSISQKSYKVHLVTK